MDATWWEHRYRSGDTPWDHGGPHPALLERLRAHPPPPGLRVLVPGCGSGHDARAWAEAGAQVTGLDLAPSALAVARTHPVGQAIDWVVGSIFEPPPRLLRSFDLVFEHTCFCAIDPTQRSDYVRGVHACLRPGGQLLAIFYLDPGRESGPPFGVDPDALASLFQPAFVLREKASPAVTFPGREGREEIRVWVAL